MSFMKKVLGVLKEMGEGFTEGADLALKEQDMREVKRRSEAELRQRAMMGDPSVLGERPDIWVAYNKPSGA